MSTPPVQKDFQFSPPGGPVDSSAAEAADGWLRVLVELAAGLGVVRAGGLGLCGWSLPPVNRDAGWRRGRRQSGMVFFWP